MKTEVIEPYKFDDAPWYVRLWWYVGKKLIGVWYA